MFDDDDRPRFDSAALPAAGWGARMRFCVRRRPAELAAFGGLFAGGGGAVLIVLASGFWSAGNEVVFIAFVAIAFATLLTAIMLLFVTRERVAMGNDFAAALAAATAHERPHLLVAIENRLSSRLWSAPMTTFELVLAFEEVREQHGDRARRKRLVDQHGRIKQERLVGQLAGVASDKDRAGQGAF